VRTTRGERLTTRTVSKTAVMIALRASAIIQAQAENATMKLCQAGKAQ
jgi:hypothetical protein